MARYALAMNRCRLGWCLALALSSLWPASSLAMCPAPQYSGVLRTPTDAALPQDLPLLVGVVADQSGAPMAMGTGELIQLTLTVTRGEFAQALTGTWVGPGLLAYRAEPALAAGEYVLSGLREPVTLRVDAVTLPPLGAPQLGTITHEERELEGRWGGRQWTDSISVTSALPPHAVALVFEMYGSRTHLALTPAMLGRAATLEFRGGYDGHCGSDRPPGDDRISGARTQASLVDHWGRKSAPSAEVAVTQVGALAESRPPAASAGSSRCDVTPGAHPSPWVLGGLTLLAVALLRRREGLPHE